MDDPPRSNCRRSNSVASGESGIRTHGTLLGYTRFPVVPVRPLRHLSVQFRPRAVLAGRWRDRLRSSDGPRRRGGAAPPRVPARLLLRAPCGPSPSLARPAAVLRWASSARRSRTSSGSCSPPSSAFGPRGTPGIHAGTYRFRSSVALRCWGAGHDERRERRGWDSNPRCLFRAHTISSRAPSTGLGHLSRSRSCNPRPCASQPEKLRRTSDGTRCRFHPRVAGDARPDVNRGVAACRPPRTAGAAPRRTRAAAARSRRPRRPP